MTELPVLDVEFDASELQRAPAATREAFHKAADSLEAAGYFAADGLPAKEWAFLDLDRYAGFDEYVAACRRVQGGAALRQARKAERAAYYSKYFHAKAHLGDIVAINTSAPERQGRPMAAHYSKTVQERGGYPARHLAEQPPAQTLVWTRHFGVFRDAPGHTQGPVEVGEELVAYIVLRRVANFAVYNTILGHADHLGRGVVYKMHLDLVRYLLDAGGGSEDPSVRGLRYLFYANYFVAGEGLRQWKKKMLFEPGYFRFQR